VFPEDQGMYMVKAYNQYGMSQCKAMLVVVPDVNKQPQESIPTFTSKLSDVTGVVGEPLSLTVQLKEPPTPTYRVEWFRVSLSGFHICCMKNWVVTAKRLYYIGALFI